MAENVIIGIYCIQNQVNGKRYIGQSNNIYRRWREHRRRLTKKNRSENSHFINAWHKYGEENFDFSIIETCGLFDLNDREKYWIAYYNSSNQDNGYNKTDGGQSRHKLILTDEEKKLLYKCGDESSYHILTEAQVKEIIIRLVNGEYCKDIANDYGVCSSTITSIRSHKTWQYLTEGVYFPKVKSKYCPAKKGNVVPKQVDMYRLDGTFVCTFPSMRKAAQAVGQKDISNICRGKGISIKGYIFRYHGHSFDEFEIRKMTAIFKGVDQYDMKWQYIRSFDSITEADNFFGSRKISYALTSITHTAYGYHWLYSGEQPPEYNGPAWKISQYDLNWNLIRHYETAAEAARDIGKDYSTINHIIDNPRKTAGGYHWLRYGTEPPTEVNNDNANWKAVCQYDTRWNLIASYKSIKQAGEKTGICKTEISAVLKKRHNTAGGYCWLYKDEQPPKEAVVNSTYIIVDRYDLDGNYLNTYESISDAARDVGVSTTSITSAVTGKTNKAGGYRWCYHGSQPLENRADARFTSIDQYDKNWNYITTYEMVKQACIATGKCESVIYASLRDINKTAGGYHWLRHGERPPILTA